MPESKHLGEYLVEAHIISQDQLERALHLQKERNGFLGQILLEMGWLNEDQLCQAISEVLHVDYMDLDSVVISPDVVKLIPESLAVTSNVLPLFVHENTIYLAMENPLDAGVIQLIEFGAGMRVKPLVAPSYQIERMFQKYYRLKEEDTHLPEQTVHAPTPHQEEYQGGVPNEIEMHERYPFQEKRIGELLVQSGVIGKRQLAAALRLQKARKGFLGQLLVEIGWAEEEDICQAISTSLHVEIFNEKKSRITPEILGLIPESLAISSNILPVSIENETLYLAMENPLDVGVIQLIEFGSGMHVKPLVAPPSLLKEMIQKYYKEDTSQDDA